MALTLTNSIDATQREFAVTGAVTIEPGYRFRLGDELLELQGFVQPRNTVHVVRNLWYVRRGLDLSTAATHANGTEVKGATDAFVSATSGTTPPDPFADGGPGGPVAASDVSLSPEVAGASDVQSALEALAGAFRLVGPYTVTFDDVGLDQATGKALFTPPVGSFVIEATGRLREAWDDPDDEVPYLALGSWQGAAENVWPADAPYASSPAIGLTAAFSQITTPGTDYDRIASGASIVSDLETGLGVGNFTFGVFTEILTETPICAKVIQDDGGDLFIGPTTHGIIDLYFVIAVPVPLP